MTINTPRIRSRSTAAALSLMVLACALSHAANALQIASRNALSTRTDSQDEVRQANLGPGAAHHYSTSSYATARVAGTTDRASTTPVDFNLMALGPLAAHHYS